MMKKLMTLITMAIKMMKISSNVMMKAVSLVLPTAIKLASSPLMAGRGWQPARQFPLSTLDEVEEQLFERSRSRTPEGDERGGGSSWDDFLRGIRQEADDAMDADDEDDGDAH